ncbi:MAG: polymerase [Thermoplasmata archaeon]|jgi:DNA polymerase (family 10)|nr:polymerase [Thermoplasmata archaeon]
MDNAELAALLEGWADVQEQNGSRGYRTRAYRTAAGRIATWPEPLEAMAKAGKDLQVIPGVGPSIAARIHQVLAAGGWPEVQQEMAAPKADHVRRPVRTGLWAALKGDLHSHTNATDGRDTMLAMAREAEARGYEYVAITDHSKDTRVAGGLSEERMKLHLQRIRRLDQELDGITVLAGAEVDILRDGRLDYPDALLQEMDVVVCSVHFRHKLTGPEQTARILAGMANDHADILGHPTGRREGLRPGMELDLERITDAAADQGWALEMNGSPERMDLDAAGAKLCAAKGVLVSCDSDAHSLREFNQSRNACREAERAGLTPKQILNTRGLRDLRKALRS